jgi:hypothetical protein
MKKVFALFIAAGMITFMACGGGKDKVAAQAKLDSLKKDSLMKDSTAKVVKAAKLADSLKQVKIADSLKQDSINKKGGKKEVKKAK